MSLADGRIDSLVVRADATLKPVHEVKQGSISDGYPTWLLVLCWSLCFEAVVAFGILSCYSREMVFRLRRLAILTRD